MSPFRRPCQRTRGFTLVELLVASTVLVVISAISFPNLVRFYEAQKLRQAAIELQSHLRRGRTLAQRLQNTCSFTISSGAGGAAVEVAGSVGTPTPNACAVTSLATLNLSRRTDVRDLCVSSTGSATSGCTAPAAIRFLPLGVLAGTPRTLFISGTGTPAQACLELNLTLIRVGFRPAGSGACTYSRS